MASAIGGTLVSTLKDRLESLADVERADIDERGAVCVVCRSHANVDGVRAHVAQTLAAELGPAADAVAVELVSAGASVDQDRVDSLSRQRVRFDGVEVEEVSHRRVRVRVFLEWHGQRCVGEADGEPGETIELRTAILAGISAVEQVAGASLGLRLVGVKRVRAFDSELMVVSLYRHREAPHKLVGAVLAGDDAHRAAALALLNALNRILGNYLVTGG